MVSKNKAGKGKMSMKNVLAIAIVALIVLAAAIFTYWKSITVCYNNGLAHMKVGRYKEAINDFNWVVRLNPWHADAYSNRGSAKIKTALIQITSATISLFSLPP